MHQHEKTEKKIMMTKTSQKKRQVSLHQGLNPNHGLQPGAVRCSTHWAAGNFSAYKTSQIKPRKIGQTNNLLCNRFAIESISSKKPLST